MLPIEKPVMNTRELVVLRVGYSAGIPDGCAPPGIRDHGTGHEACTGCTEPAGAGGMEHDGA